ncbi:MAG: 23S rRNA (adenine(2030)-N(6))-methyltransferase RlmJ [Paracoccaceae bacterium]
MLSYQHSYHAGNLADVHKHALLAAMLDYLTRKPKALSYIETHAGRGLYRLDSAEAAKTGEARAGIERLASRFAPDHPYSRALGLIRKEHGAQAYPGSPLLAATLLRRFDRMYLADLHPQEFAALEALMRPRHALCRQEDGLAFALSVTPPDPRRGLMLIDPSYEVKAEYTALPERIAAIHRRWNVGVIALWYPILTSAAHRPMLDALRAMAMPKTLIHEVRFAPAREGHGMVGSGMAVINAPFGLQDEADRLSALFAPLAKK